MGMIRRFGCAGRGRATPPAELDEWVAGLEALLDALGVPVVDEVPPARVWAGIERHIASAAQEA